MRKQNFPMEFFLNIPLESSKNSVRISFWGNQIIFVPLKHYISRHFFELSTRYNGIFSPGSDRALVMVMERRRLGQKFAHLNISVIVKGTCMYDGLDNPQKYLPKEGSKTFWVKIFSAKNLWEPSIFGHFWPISILKFFFIMGFLWGHSRF